MKNENLNSVLDASQPQNPVALDQPASNNLAKQQEAMSTTADP
jgi:hypothetical protein